MLVKRNVKTDTDFFEIGDILEFNLTDGEEVQAMAVDYTSDGMLFVLVDCLEKEYLMFNCLSDINEDTSYLDSDLRKALNKEILDRFPQEIRKRMKAVNDEGDMLRIPTEYEIFGKNTYGQKEDETKHWEPMKKRRNRIAFQGKEGILEWYWLENRNRHTLYFSLVYSNGSSDFGNASYFYGVRPVFCLKISL